MALDIECIPALSDNYIWLLHEPTTKVTAVVDPSEARPVIQALERRGLNLQYILNTHHHWDHTGGNEELKRKYSCTVVGPLADEKRIPGIDIKLGQGDVWKLGALDMHVFDTPGHTRGHISLWFPQAQALFPGDTLFSLGCGRLFEGNPQQMWASLSQLRELPPETKVYCAHEYTQSNARFALHVDPENPVLQARQEEVDKLRREGRASIPSTLGEELQANPFLRPQDPVIRQAMKLGPDIPDWQVFGAVRAAKDNF